ncbi:MAG: tryptophan--tRNA ligase [Gammaproteobacteria bacterium]|jgi:tryptophanyl-tRNA synthetase|nr:tryptophan--tRNA ligase [Gammaproteobacteria bacterium]
MNRQTVLTGITTTGIPHLGNYVGAIRPAIEASRTAENNAYYFLADYHALVKNRDPRLLRESSLAVAATWLALGLDTANSVFYRQSDVPQIAELSWILSTVTAKGLMNRAHAYKAAVQENEDSGSRDPDKGITMGLFSYPVLMAADILMFNAHQVPVGKDQIQHVEMARDIAQRFNHIYGEVFVLPKAVVDERAAILTGLDGRKMSKSYNNTIPLFLPAKQLRKQIMKIKTNSLEPGEPKDPDDSTVFELFSAFADVAAAAEFRQELEAGLAWGDAKQRLFECLDAQLAGPREEYRRLLEDPSYVEATLVAGSSRACAAAAQTIDAVRQAVGISKLA